MRIGRPSQFFSRVESWVTKSLARKSGAGLPGAMTWATSCTGSARQGGGRFAAPARFRQPFHLIERLPVGRGRILLLEELDACQDDVERPGPELTGPRQVVADGFIHRLGLADFALAVVEELAGVLQAAFQLVTQDVALVRLAAGGVAALDDPLQLVCDAGPRVQPDGVGPLPGGAVGAGLVPFHRLLHADDLQTPRTADSFLGDDSPARGSAGPPPLRSRPGPGRRAAWAGR